MYVVYNGETLVEGRGVLEPTTENDKSSWWKLQDYIKERNLTIQSFGLWTGDRHYNLPSVNPKFNGQAPISYNCFRRFGQNILMGQGNVEHYICAEAIYEDFTVQLWLDEQDSSKSWVNVVENEHGKK